MMQDMRQSGWGRDAVMAGVVAGVVAVMMGGVCRAAPEGEGRVSHPEAVRNGAAARSPATRAATQPADTGVVRHPSPPISERAKVKKALEFLAGWQSPNGSWDRIENADPDQQFNPGGNRSPLHFQRARGEVVGETPFDTALRKNDVPFLDDHVKDLAETQIEQVADTCLGGLAILQARGDSEFRTKYTPHLLKSINFVCKQVAAWDNDTIFIQNRAFDPLHDPTPARWDLRYYDSTVDTFFALWLLSEVRGKMSDKESEQLVDKAIRILVRKIERNQNPQGTWIDETNSYTSIAGKFYEGVPHAILAKNKFNPRTIEEAPLHAVDNITTHGIATATINMAVRRGVAFQDKTIQRANKYMMLAVKPSEHDAEAIASAVFGLHHAELTAMEMVAAARMLAEKSTGEKAKEQAVMAAKELEVRLGQLSTAKRNALRMTVSLTGTVMPTLKPRGVVIPLLPTLVDEIALVSAEGGRRFDRECRKALLERQQGDGRITGDAYSYPVYNPTKYGPIATAGGNLAQRGDNTFSTAAALLLLTRPELGGRDEEGEAGAGQDQ